MKRSSWRFCLLFSSVRQADRRAREIFVLLS